MCPFECCTYRRWVARRPLRAYLVERDSEHVGFTIARGDSFDALTGDVYVTRAGVGRVFQAHRIGTESGDSLSLRPGDEIALLDFAGDAGYHAWIHGHFTGLDEDDLWPTKADVSGGSWVRVVREPKTQWWVRIRTLDGREAWIWPHAREDEDDGVGNSDNCS